MTANAATSLSTAAPSSAESAESWTEANQRYLLAELARLRERLGSKNESRVEEALRAATIAIKVQTTDAGAIGTWRRASRAPARANGSANTEWLKRTKER